MGFDSLLRLRPWVNAVLVLILMLPVARLTWRWVLPKRPALSAPARPQAAAAPLPGLVLDLGDLRRSALFGVAAVAAPGGELPVSRWPLKLTGVIAAGESPASAAVFDGADPKQRSIRVGMDIQPGVTLKAVLADHVVIRNQGRDERLNLQKPQAGSNAIAPAQTSPSSAYPPGVTPAGASFAPNYSPAYSPRNGAMYRGYPGGETSMNGVPPQTTSNVPVSPGTQPD